MICCWTIILTRYLWDLQHDALSDNRSSPTFRIVYMHSFITIVCLFLVSLLQRAATMFYYESYRHMKPLSGTPTVSVTIVWSQPKREKGRGVFSSSSSALKEKQEEKGKLFETHSNHLLLGKVYVRRRGLTFNIWAYVLSKQPQWCLKVAQKDKLQVHCTGSCVQAFILVFILQNQIQVSTITMSYNKNASSP